MPNIIGTNLFSVLDANSTRPALTDEGNQTFLTKASTSNIPSAVAGYAIGCTLVDTITGIVYVNTGSTASCTFTKTGIVNTGNKGYYQVATVVNGIGAVNVFGATNGFASTVTGVMAVAGNLGTSTLIITGSAGTVASIVTVSTGALVGAMALTNTALLAAGTLTVNSLSATDTTSRVFITFTTT